jgi:hypothetical protein
MPGTVTSSFLLVVAMAGAGAAAEAPPTAGAPSATVAAAMPALTGEGWHFLIAPYMWGVNTSGNLTLGPISSDFDLPLSTALKQLKAAFQVRGEVRHDRLGIAVDFTNLEVAKGGAFAVPLPPGSSTSGDLDLRMQFLEAWPYYRLGDDSHAFDLLAGIRYDSFRTRVDLKTAPLAASRQINWTDPIVGARWVGRVKPKLALSARADVGGFGAGSRFTVNVQGGFDWQFSRLAGLVVQYRWMKIDHEKGELGTLDYSRFEPSMKGVVLGVPISW